VRTLVLLTSVVLLLGNGALAGVCSYRPSQIIGGAGAAAIAATGGTTAVVGSGLKVAGFYTLTHSVTGATMLGSIAGGASGASTVGIMGGTGAGIGAVASALMAPVVVGTAAFVAIGTAGFEGACFFTDERITEYPEVLAKLQAVATVVADSHFSIEKAESPSEALLVMKTVTGERVVYAVQKLYIVNGVLMHRDWFRNSVLGSLVYSK
jgi:hypothetical protein